MEPNLITQDTVPSGCTPHVHNKHVWKGLTIILSFCHFIHLFYLTTILSSESWSWPDIMPAPLILHLCQFLKPYVIAGIILFLKTRNQAHNSRVTSHSKYLTQKNLLIRFCFI